MKEIDQKYFINPESHIPKGLYCYDDNGMCPFWDEDDTKPPQENGYCHFLKKGDWDINSTGATIQNCNTGESYTVDYYPFSLLWDEVKECGVKDNVEIDEDELAKYAVVEIEAPIEITHKITRGNST